MTRCRRFNRRRGIALSIVVAVSLAAAFAGSHTPARAQDAGPPANALGGYQGSAASSGLHAYYTPEGLLPLGAIVDVGAPDALATITSGPSTFARASAADPGDVIANPDAIAALGISGYPQGTLPAYPYRVTATSGYGEPRAESAPAPGLHARAEVGPGTSIAEATMPMADAPAVATFGSLSALSTTKTDGSTVSVHVRTQVGGFNLLNMLRVDSIVTDLTATSAGHGTTLVGTTIITGASLLGQPVTIDATGVHQSPDDTGIGAAIGNVIDSANQLLTQAGIHITLAGPVKQEGATVGELASSGLRIDLEISDRTFPVIGQLAALVPTLPDLAPGVPSLDDALAAAQARHLSHIEVARGAVSLTATPAFLFDDLSAPLPDLGVTYPGDGQTPVLPPMALPPVVQTAAKALSPIARTGTGREPNLPLGAGVGAMGLLLLLAQPIVGMRLAGVTSTLLRDGEAVSCPNGRR